VIEATTSSPPGSRITTIDITAPSSIEEMTPASWFLALICTPQRTALRRRRRARPGATEGGDRLHNWAVNPSPAIDPQAVIWSEPIDPDRPLLVLLHGRGANEADLAGIVPFLPRGPVVASLRAPIADGPGFSWYPMNTPDRAAAFSLDVESAVQAVLDWIDAQPHARPVGLLGFSQGGAMAIELLRTRPAGFAFGIVLSGFVIDGERGGDEELGVLRPPVFWGRGIHDPVISESRIEQAAEWLPTHSTLDERTYDTAHSITEGELADVATFINANL
jgi:phospholipase/carboxylesterase